MKNYFILFILLVVSSVGIGGEFKTPDQIIAEENLKAKPLEIKEIDKFVRSIDKKLRKAKSTRERDKIKKEFENHFRNRRVLLDPKKCTDMEQYGNGAIVYYYKKRLRKKSSKGEATYMNLQFSISQPNTTPDHKEPILLLVKKTTGIPTGQRRSRFTTFVANPVEW